MQRIIMSYKAKTAAEPRRFFTIVFQSVLSGSLNRANACAGSAVNTLISVDDVFSVFFGNAGYRAVVCASAASDALVKIDYIRHNIFSVPTAAPSFLLVNSLYHKIAKSQIFFRNFMKI